jgi:hypothetical protein
MNSVLNDVQYWRDCAEEARALAATVYFDFTRQQMLEIAERYERLAKQAEERTKVSPIVLRGARIGLRRVRR